MEIKDAIIHGLDKDSGSKLVGLEPRPTKLAEIDERMNKLGAAILKIYGETPSNYGAFDKDHDVYKFPSHLNNYLSSDPSLLNFSLETLNLIAAKIADAHTATGGFVLFLRYSNAGRDWLLIVMLKLKPGTGIDRNTFQLSDSMSFDVDHLHEAARIDLEKYKTNTQPYLSFIKKSGRQDDVTQYFRRAIGCTDYTEAKYNTVELLKAVDAYCDDFELPPEEKQKVRRKTYDYCEEKRTSREPVNLTSLSAHINDQEPEKFITYARQGDFDVSETFDPHKATYSKYQRIKGKFGSVSVGFDVEDIINETVDYDEENNWLIIHDIPARLIRDIRRAKGDDEVAE